MGIIQQVQQVSGAHYVLPRSGPMRCDVHAWLSPSLLALTDEALWAQARAAACYPGAIGLHLMPDTHLGYSIPVGGVLITEDTLVQAGSGYDISCGVVHLKVPGLHAADVADPARRRAWVNAVEQRVATGVGNHRARLQRQPNEALIEQIFHQGAAAIGVSEALCERQFIEVDSRHFDASVVEKARRKAAPQLGSVGGGNHFIELQVDQADGAVWVMVHCGSRGFGWQTANHFFYAGAAHRGLKKNQRERSWLGIEEPLGQQYWAHHNAAANYAVANRWTIVNAVQEATRQVFSAEVEPFYEISHNLVQQETLWLPDGTTQRGFVHRKGATRAFPAGHPDLAGTPWANTGHPCCVPGSMLSGAAILYPLDGARRSACSVNHGAGRIMGRSQANRSLSARHDDIDREMQTIERTLGGVPITGIIGNTERTPLDECGHVYKDLDEVLQTLEMEAIATVAHRLFPVANIKGTN